MIDMHIHLDEGPYYSEYGQRIMNVFENTYRQNGNQTNLMKIIQCTYEMIDKSGYSEAWLDEYLKAAKQKGIKHIGIVDHIYRFSEFENYFKRNITVDESEIGQAQLKWLNQVKTTSVKEYIEVMRKAKEKWASHGIQLSIGLEVDYFEHDEAMIKSLLEDIEVDYLIGSVHFYKGWGFDNPVLQEKFQSYDLITLYEDHFNTVIKAIESRLFDFIAHLDNIKVFNYRPDESHLIPMYHQVAQALRDNDIATEVNAGLKYRYPVKEQCPSEKFISVLKDYQVDFTTSSDSHLPTDIGIFNKEIIDILKRHSINQVVRFESGQKISHKI